MGFYGVPWSSMRFYDVPVNQSVPTEANRGLTSYTSTVLVQQRSAIQQPITERYSTRLKVLSAKCIPRTVPNHE
jgi:hypothetical protein